MSVFFSRPVLTSLPMVQDVVYWFPKQLMSYFTGLLSIFYPLSLKKHKHSLPKFDRPWFWIGVIITEWWTIETSKSFSYEINKALNAEPFLWIDRSQLRSPILQNVPRKIDEVSPAGYTQGKAVQRSSEDQVELPYLRPCLVQQNYLRLLLAGKYFESS